MSGQIEGINNVDVELDYFSLYHEESLKPQSERQPLPVGRNGRVIIPRRYAYSSEKVSELRAKSAALGESVINPLPRTGPYRGFVQSLIDLGVNEWHSHAKVKQMMRDIMDEWPSTKKDGSTKWDDFESRNVPGAKKSKDVNGKIQDNAKTMQRVKTIHCYGMKLAQFCMSVDIHREPKDGEPKRDVTSFPKPGTYYYRLKTDWDNPDAVVPLYCNNSVRKKRSKTKSADS